MDQENAKPKTWSTWGLHAILFVLIAAFYLLTRPVNHAESYDGITYALIAENYPLGTAHDSRNILFHAVNRSLFVATQWAGFETRALDVIAIFNCVTASLSLLLFARLMRVVFNVAATTSWIGAAFLGLTYGFWRYAGEAEVYVPSIFLVIGSLSLLFRFLKEEADSKTELGTESNASRFMPEKNCFWFLLESCQERRYSIIKPMRFRCSLPASCFSAGRVFLRSYLTSSIQ